jgi:hypothetical protein
MTRKVNDEIRMTNDELMSEGSNVQMTEDRAHWVIRAFGHCFVIRHSNFVIAILLPPLLSLLLTVPIHAQSRPAGLDSLGDDALLSEMAERGLDDLLDRAFDQDKIPPERRQAIHTLASLQRLAGNAHLTEQQRQALLDGVVNGVDQILATVQNDPDLLVQKAGIIAEKGVDPQAGLLEYWGESPSERAKLRPLAQAALKMYDLAAQTATARANDLANHITSPDDKLAEQWQKASDLAGVAAYKKAQMQYALALSLDPNDSQRADLIDQSLKAFERWDNADSGVQPQVRLLEAKLNVLTGDKDAIAKAKQMIDTLVKNPGNQISPAPTPELVFEAMCYSVITSLSANDLPGAQTALSEATAYQQAHFANDREQLGALRLLGYRLLAMRADQAPAGSEKDTANAAAVNALAQLVTDFPGLRDAIYRQLAARLPANPDPAKLDPMLLLALVEQGRQQVVGAPAAVDKAKVQLALSAAREILSRYSSASFPAAQAVEPSLLEGVFLENLGDKLAAVDAFLDHIARFGNDPRSNAKFALDEATNLLGELRQSSTDPQGKLDPQVQRVQERFLPVAINPPFNHLEFAQLWASTLLDQEKWAEALKYYKMVPDSEPPERRLAARYGEMVALKELEESPGASAAQRKAWMEQIERLADTVKSLANQLINSSTSEQEKMRAKSTLARMSLLAADITRQHDNDPQRVLQLLNGFENSVAGLPDAKSLINGALFLRVQADMQLGRDNDATQTLVQYLNATSAAEGEQTVHDLLLTLSNQLDKARAAGDTAAEAALAANRATLSGFLVKWASDSSDPKIRAYAYTYRRFDADVKRQAAELQTDPAVRQRDLQAALALYKQLQSPANVTLYQAGLEPGADKEYPDPLVMLGIGLISYDLGDCHAVKSTLGPLIQNEKLGEDNDEYWEATFKLLDCMHTLAASGDKDTTEADVQKSLKIVYLIWRDGTGGKKWHDKFEQLRKAVIPDWSPPPSAK